MRRFAQSVREDGIRVALAKVRQFVAMRWAGGAHSSLTEHQDLPAQQGPQGSYLRGVWAQLAQAEAFHPSAPSLGKGRRFVAIVGDLNLPQCKKYRVEQLAAFWRSQGVSCDYAHYEDLPRAVRLMNQATHLVEYRLQSNAMTEMLRYEARRLKLPVLYDIDDPLFSVVAYETYGNMIALDPWLKQHFLSEAPKYLTMMNGADIMTMSTPGLVEHAALHSPRPVFMRRNFADDATLEDGAAAIARRVDGDGRFRVCFASGSQGHEVDFAEIAEPLTEFILAADNRRLRLLGHFDTKHLSKEMVARCEVMPFTDYAGYLDNLAAADCAVMPLGDDLFNRCKSAVRVIDAHSVGVPVIVGPVGDMCAMVEDGKTGHIAHSAADWRSALDTLAADTRARKAMGRTARRTLEAEWGGQAAPHIIAPEIIQWVRE
ncbi:MAG: glycosyltransferase [Pseudomonadota bacterium]